MIHVSVPQDLLLVRAAHEPMHETTLVVPELPLEKLEYARCLVNSGQRFVEHAVVLLTEPLSDGARELVVRSLTAARPTFVSFLDTRKMPGSVSGASSLDTEKSSLAASAVLALKQGAQDIQVLRLLCAGTEYSVRVVRERGFFLVDVNSQA